MFSQLESLRAVLRTLVWSSFPFRSTPRAVRNTPRAWLTQCLTLVGLVFVGGGCSSRETDVLARSSVTPLQLRVASNSMEPTLLGPQSVVRCEECGELGQVPWQAETLRFPVRCYRCGGVCLLTEETIAGQRVLLSPTPIARKHPRLAVVGFRASKQAAVQVKRVWGLPGESVAIRQGELWIDGKWFQKGFAELEQVAVPIAVFPDSQASPMLRPLASAGFPLDSKWRWQFQRHGRVHPGEGRSATWLVASGLVDEDPWNQPFSYQPVPVHDWMCTLELKQALAHPLEIRGRCYGRELIVRIDPVDEIRDLHAKESRLVIQSQQVRLALEMRKSLRLAICDGRLLSDCDSAQVQVEDLSSVWQARSEIAADFELSLHALSAAADSPRQRQAMPEIESMQIARDMVLRSYPQPDAEQEFPQLAPDEYLLLGDNQVVSSDSRNGLGPVPQSQILGDVTATVP
ncbi:S26 family signal peptidase [Aureliella helgolandensis]|uniref:Signal peptidase I n=1 Tax=Aureliella helgolandensis TaxID=2527968 RepID=A0A518G1F0_9BACT|nr:S26 family signal peptidase [Aureliella helgolandensis]QDV22427.1 hypothetical protein Q31a_07120 [Aureliella helgolandensis]